MNLLLFLYEFFIPRFITEEVVFNLDENDEMMEVVPKAGIYEGGVFEYQGICHCFTWFGYGFLGTIKDIEGYYDELEG